MDKLILIDSLESKEKADSIIRWINFYLQKDVRDSFDLELPELKKISEYFYKNIIFMKEERAILKNEIDKSKNIKRFFT